MVTLDSSPLVTKVVIGRKNPKNPEESQRSVFVSDAQKLKLRQS
jgi:hypothetical protein